jgi:hypothetical protein
MSTTPSVVSVTVPSAGLPGSSAPATTHIPTTPSADSGRGRFIGIAILVLVAFFGGVVWVSDFFSAELQSENPNAENSGSSLSGSQDQTTDGDNDSGNSGEGDAGNAAMSDSTVPIPSPTITRPTNTPRPTMSPLVEDPPIQSRGSWGARNPGSNMVGHTPMRIVLTHEGGAPCCGGEDPRDRIYSNQGIHMDVKGWPDIAFHYIIAPDGVIYTGRSDRYRSDSSYDDVNPGYNLDGTIVVGVLGNYDVQQPTQESIQSAEWLMAWLCQEHGISPTDIYQLRNIATNDVSGGQTTSPGISMPNNEEFRNNVVNILEGIRTP